MDGQEWTNATDRSRERTTPEITWRKLCFSTGAVAAAAGALFRGGLFIWLDHRLSLDWARPRQPITLELSLEDKLQLCPAQ